MSLLAMPSATGIESLLEAAAKPNDLPSLAGKTVCMAFFEPSTRTRLSFEAAALRLGARVIGFSDVASTSGAKGETLEDTIRVLSGYCDAIVLRHPETGAAERAEAVASVPIINAGDGAGQHPSQTLLDLFTIKQHYGRINVKVAFIGDLKKGRTVHSLAPAIEAFGGSWVQVPAESLGWGSAPMATLGEAIATCDVLYVTRVQTERGSDAAAPPLNAAQLTDFKGIVMHPLPRVNEISTDVDALPCAKYFEQASNGVPMRMAILAAELS
jgi:aspartate carbamoyltransferase catalytic subunit